jgi:hypothetical protein
MKTTHTRSLTAAALICAVAFTTTIARAADPLPSWKCKAWIARGVCDHGVLNG